MYEKHLFILKNKGIVMLEDVSHGGTRLIQGCGAPLQLWEGGGV